MFRYESSPVEPSRRTVFRFLGFRSAGARRLARMTVKFVLIASGCGSTIRRTLRPDRDFDRAGRRRRTENVENRLRHVVGLDHLAAV